MEATGILRTVNRLWNGTTAVGDPIPGESTPGYVGQPPRFSGQLGAWARLSWADAQKRSDPASATPLQSGKYQYVQYAADGTNYAQGQVLYWKDETLYIVTNVAPTSTAGNVAGIAVAPVTQGNYWFVQVSGVAYVQYQSVVTGTVVGQLVVVVVNTNTADALLDATAVTDTVLKRTLGVAKDQPANAALGRIYLKGLVQVE